MPTFHHHFHVQAPLAAVAAFHRRSASMGAITPPPIIARVQRAPAELSEGDEMAFTLWLGPVPLRWLARIEEVSPTGFTDRQLAGPFRQWVHRHNFTATAEGVEVHDQITVAFQSHPFWWLIGRSMWLGMPLLFAYRGWKTRRLLRQRAAA